jgi:hypothetical protein
VVDIRVDPKDFDGMLFLSAAEAGPDDVSDFRSGFQKEHIVDTLLDFRIDGIALPPSRFIGHGYTSFPIPLGRFAKKCPFCPKKVKKKISQDWEKGLGEEGTYEKTA